MIIKTVYICEKNLAVYHKYKTLALPKMASANFEQVKCKDGKIKFRARFSDKKEVNVTTLKGKCYVHIADLKKAIKDGKFEKTAVKQVSLNVDEVRQLKFIMLGIEPKIKELICLQVKYNSLFLNNVEKKCKCFFPFFHEILYFSIFWVI